MKTQMGFDLGKNVNLEGRKIQGIVEELKELKGRVESLVDRCSGGGPGKLRLLFTVRCPH